MRTGITGWQGFIGSNLKRLVTEPVCFEGDLRDLATVKTFVGACDRIYHIAGLNRANEGDILSNNLTATGNLLLAMKLLDYYPEFIFTSSKQVQTNLSSEYGLTKLIEEKIVKMMRRWCIFRVPNVYGIGCRPFYNSVVSTFAHQIVHGQKVVINDPTATRDFISITDLCEKLICPKFSEILDVKGEKMSIGEVYKHLVAGDHLKLNECLEYEKGVKV